MSAEEKREIEWLCNEKLTEYYDLHNNSVIIMRKLVKRKSRLNISDHLYAPNPSPEAFEDAFQRRLGQSPQEWVETKVDGGSTIDSIRYLFQLNASTVAKEINCVQQDFEEYYEQYLKSKEVNPVHQTVSKTYNKLVRDRIPEIIEASGRTCTCKTLSAEDYISMLDAKLNEELTEYQESKSLEELADLLEVMGAVVKARGYTWDQLTETRKKKLEERGGFEKRVLLVEVTEEKELPDETAPAEKRQVNHGPATVKHGRHLPTNAGKPWLPEDDKKLGNMFDNKCPIEDMCAYFKRTRGAITARLVHIGKIQRNPNQDTETR